jgi:hypothetical protein
MKKQRRNNAADLINQQPVKNSPFESPGNYRIRVRGHIDESLADQLGGMVITKAFTADKEPMTILIGHMKDQSALSGVLNELYELHLPLLTVELLSSQSDI